MEQQTASKSGKEYIKAVCCHPAYLTYMQSISWEMPGWMKHKLESRFSSVQFSHSIVSDSATPWIATRQASLSITNSRSSLRRSSSRWCYPAISSSVFPFSCPQFLPASVFSNESTLRMRCLKYWSFSFTGRNINNCRYADDTTLMAENKELKSLSMKVKEESGKVGLKLNFRKLRSWHLVPSLHGK